MKLTTSFSAGMLLLVTTSFLWTNAQDIRLPPSITENLPQSSFHKDKSRVALTCVATGDPLPTMRWLKNGADLSFIGIIPPVLPDGNGTIEILEMSAAHTGDYQCLASNDYGTAMTTASIVRLATLGEFGNANTKREYNVTVNDKLRLLCSNPPPSVPEATYYWSYNTTTQGLPQTITASNQFQVDFNGDLCFASVSAANTQGKLYRCNAQNEALIGTTVYGAHSTISTLSGSINAAAPVIFFSSPAKVLGLRSQQTVLRCFFYANDNNGQDRISYSWTYKGVTTLPPGWTPRWDGTEIVSSQDPGTVYTDAGTYVCTGSNKMGQANVTIELVVESIPDFGEPTNRPHDMNVTEGDIVTISCNPDAVPTASVQWFKDAAPFDDSSLPPKFELSADLLTLTITDVCKNCSDGTSDLMVIQCNASNIHGYALAQGYVNVLLKTFIESEPVTVSWEPYKSYTFECMATCDDSTPCSVQWNFGETEIVPDDSSLIIDEFGTLHIITANDSDAGQSRIGDYKCIVTNGYSEETIVSTISGIEVASAELWWVGLLVALIVLLLLLLLLLYLFCCFCREGKSYPVDKNERKNGNDPVRELKATGFQDFVPASAEINIHVNPTFGGADEVAPPIYNERLVDYNVTTNAAMNYSQSDGSRASANLYRADPVPVQNGYPPTAYSTGARSWHASEV